VLVSNKPIAGASAIRQKCFIVFSK